MAAMRLTLWQLGGLFCFALIMAFGQLLFKHASSSLSKHEMVLGIIKQVASQPSFWIGCALYGVATILWVWLLSRVPLSIAYPIAALSLIIVPLLGWFFYSEPLSVTYWVGLLIMLSGMFVLVRG